MNNYIKIIENKSKLDLNFGIPQAQLSDEQLSKLYGGNAFYDNCKCHKSQFIPCACLDFGIFLR